MLIKRLSDCPVITANDGCRLRELLHPGKDAFALPYSLAVAGIAPGKRSYAHFLRQTEVYFILAGHGSMLEMGRMVAESIMRIERYPTHPDLQKWAHEDRPISETRRSG